MNPHGQFWPQNSNSQVQSRLLYNPDRKWIMSTLKETKGKA